MQGVIAEMIVLSKLRGLVTALCLGLAMAVVASAASAQVGFNLDLRDSDYEIIRATAAPLYENADTPIGTTFSWSNSETGNKGTVTLVAINVVNEVECRRLSHLVFIKDKGDPYNFLIDRCLIGDEWKVYP